MMRRVVTTQQMKEADEYTIRKMGIPSLVLMEWAALACVDVLKRNFRWNVFWYCAEPEITAVTDRHRTHPASGGV